MCQLHIGQFDEGGVWEYDFNENIYMVPAAGNCYVLGLSVPIATNTAVACTYWSVGATAAEEVELSEDDYDSDYNGWEWDAGQYAQYVNIWGYDDWWSASSATWTVTGSSNVAATVFDAVVERQLCASDSASVTGSVGLRYATWKAETDVLDVFLVGDNSSLTDVSASASTTFWGPAIGITGRAGLFGTLSIQAGGQLALLRGNVLEAGVEGYDWNGDVWPIDEVLDRSYWVTVPALDAVLRLACAVTPQIEIAVGYRSSSWFGAPLAPQFDADAWEWNEVQRRADVTFGGCTLGATLRF